MTSKTDNFNFKQQEKGVALVAALLLLILMSALAVALIYKVNYEQKLQSSDTGNNSAFYGAEAGMENMMAGLNSLYRLQAAPSCSDVSGLTLTPPPVSDVGVTYPSYTITLADGSSLGGCLTPPSRTQSISQGPNAGLQAQVVPLVMNVSALRPSGEAVSMIRQVEVARIPVFQFGVFSDSDLSFFPGPDFDFNGRVHTNGNLFLAATGTLTFHSPIRAAGDVVRDQLANGQGTLGQGRTGAVMIPTQPSGCDGTKPACRNLQMTSSVNEGSSVGGPTPTYGGSGVANVGPPNSWTTISTNANPFYASMILSGTTGAKILQMAFVQSGVDPIEIIRRPAPLENPSSSVAQSRLYNQAQIRVLISDDPADLPGGAGDPQNIRLGNYANAGGPDYSTGVPVDGSANRTYFAEGTTAAIPDVNTGTNITDTNWVSPPVPFSPNNTLLRTATDTNAPVKGAGPSWNLEDGYIRVEYLDKNTLSYVGVTKEWLELGFARGLTPPTAIGGNGVNPHAILLFQQLADRNADGTLNGGAASYSDPATNQSYCDNNSRPANAPGVCTGWVQSPTKNCNKSGGVYRNYTWTQSCTVTHAAVTPELATDTGTGSYATGAATRYNWYPINMYDTREGEFRDVNSGVCKVNGALNLTEIDVGNLRQWLKGSIGTSGPNVEYKSQGGYVLYFSDRRGMIARPDLGYKDGEYGFEDVLNPNSGAGTPNNALDKGEDVNNNKQVDTWGAADIGLGFGLGAGAGDPTKAVNCGIARSNWVSGARHGVRLVDGTKGNLPTRFDNDLGGFTLASENPAYILGNYNADGGGFVDPHAESAVVADTVTLLSNGWTDLNMWANPTKPGSRGAQDTWYRVAIATGKNENFSSAPYTGVPQDFGTDGGVHNFLRFLENWGSKNINYKGSMASMYYSEYATGVFKCCTSVYGAPNRNYAFDLDFQDLSKMPPGTPTVTDVENLGFQQVF
jgi:hypothetical protein